MSFNRVLGFGSNGHPLPVVVREEILRRRGLGETAAAVAAAVGVSDMTVYRVVRGHADAMPPAPPCREHRRADQLTADARERIRVGIEHGETNTAIAEAIGFDASTVSREISRNGGRGLYRALRAEVRAGEQARRPRPCKLVANARLHDAVASMLERRCSPQQISARLAIDFPDDGEMRVSHETIYQSLYVQARGGFRKELVVALRTGRVRRYPHQRTTPRGSRIADMVNISERPAEVADRAVPGHWEGDLIMGAANASAIATLVERSTRMVLLARIEGRHDAATVRDAITRSILTLPVELRRSLTWDQGNEMAQHVQFSIDTNVEVYFCNPHSPWQRGTNENTNGLLRQYFPKGTDLSVHSQDHLNAVAAELNQRPRQTLGWMTPSEKLAEHIALTA